MVHALTKSPQALDKDTVCEAHAILMRTCRLPPEHHRYIAPGKTWSESRKTVIVAGQRPIEFCSFPDVDKELTHICEAAKVNSLTIDISVLSFVLTWFRLRF